jgi:hypothetical protein
MVAEGGEQGMEKSWELWQINLAADFALTHAGFLNVQ